MCVKQVGTLFFDWLGRWE